MKKITINEIAQALIENDSMEIEGTKARYYLHITDKGEILSQRSGADESFSTYTDAPEVDYDWREEFETLDNEEFRMICEDLCDQANRYLETWGDKDREEMLQYSIEDLKSIGVREFRTVPTGNWTVSRNGRRKMETEGKEYIPTRQGKIETGEWCQLMDKAVKAEGKEDLLLQIEKHVREHCAWLRKDSEIHEYALECLSDESYLHWKDFYVPDEKKRRPTGQDAPNPKKPSRKKSKIPF